MQKNIIAERKLHIHISHIILVNVSLYCTVSYIKMNAHVVKSVAKALCIPYTSSTHAQYRHIHTRTHIQIDMHTKCFVYIAAMHTQTHTSVILVHYFVVCRVESESNDRMRG